MMNLKNVAITEKGNVKPAVRKALIDYVAENPEVFGEAERVEGKNVFTLEVGDIDGNVIYINFDVTVSNKAAADRAPRKAKAKVEKTEDEIVIE